jgi:uncharacterized phiE125 gp8 family phage protein
VTALRYRIRTITEVADVALAVGIDAVKDHLRIDFDDEDLDITAKIKAAQERLEKHMSRPLTDRELEMTLDAFPCGFAPICIPREGITAIGSVKYTDTAGVEQTLAPSAYRWSESLPDKLLPAFGAQWPSAVACEPGAVRILFNAGYADGQVPPTLVGAVGRMAAFLYENREAGSTIPPGVIDDCAAFRRHPI